MTMEDPTDDDRIDALVRQAAARPVDEARLTAHVLTRIRQNNGSNMGFWARLFAWPEFAGAGRLVPAGFALILLATPFAVAHSPANPTDRAIYALVLGDPAVIAASEGSLFGAEFLE
jgi:hypothetical protein